MKVIRFESGAIQDKIFWKTLRKNVQQYFASNNISPKGNFSMVLKSVAMLVMYIVPLVIILIYTPNVWLVLALTVVMGLGKAGIGMSVMHDAIHGSYSDKKWVNKLMGSTIYLLGVNVFNWKIQHNIFHHAYTNIEGLDEDIKNRWIIRLSEHSVFKNINKYQHVYSFVLYGLMSLSMLVGGVFKLINYNKTGITKKYNVNPTYELTKTILVKLLYLFVMIGLPLLLTPYTWWQVLIGFMTMHWVTGFILSVIFQMAHIVEEAQQPTINEHGVTKNEWAVHQLLTTANFAPKNWLLNWYVGGLNFQVEHHLFPNICHVHYPNIAPIVAKTAQEFGIPYHINPTFRGAFVSHYRRLKELGHIQHHH